MRIKSFASIALFCSALFLSAQTEKTSPEVATGISLPSMGAIFGLDSLDKKLSLLQIHLTEIVTNSHAGGNFARAQVFAGPHSSIELKGISAAATFHTSQPVFYIRLSGDDAELMRNRVQIIRLRTEKDRRIVSDLSSNLWGGHKKRRFDEIAASKSDEPNETWLKLVPQSSLEPGEYGIVFVPKDSNLFADAVYDFNIAGDPAHND